MPTDARVPTRIIEREFDRYAAMGVIAGYSLHLTDRGARYWLVIDAEGEQRRLSVAQAVSFLDGLALAQVAREEAVQ